MSLPSSLQPIHVLFLLSLCALWHGVVLRGWSVVWMLKEASQDRDQHAVACEFLFFCSLSLLFVCFSLPSPFHPFTTPSPPFPLCILLLIIIIIGIVIRSFHLIAAACKDQKVRIWKVVFLQSDQQQQSQQAQRRGSQFTVESVAELACNQGEVGRLFAGCHWKTKRKPKRRKRKGQKRTKESCKRKTNASPHH